MPLSHRSIKAVIFDLDGTLVDTESLSDRAIFLALRDYLSPSIYHHLTSSCTPNNENNCESAFRLPWKLKRQILGLRGSDWGPVVLQYAQQHWQCDSLPSPQQLWDDWEQHLSALCPHVQACPGSYELIQQLWERSIPMAIATSSRGAAAQTKLTHNPQHKASIYDKMSVIVTGDDPAVECGKPAPDIYIEAAKRLKTPPEQCLVIEDAMSGVQAGASAGCAAVAVPDPRFTAEERLEFGKLANVVLGSLEEFDGTIFGLDVKLCKSDRVGSITEN